MQPPTRKTLISLSVADSNGTPHNRDSRKNEPFPVYLRSRSRAPGIVSSNASTSHSSIDSPTQDRLAHAPSTLRFRSSEVLPNDDDIATTLGSVASSYSQRSSLKVPPRTPPEFFQIYLPSKISSSDPAVKALKDSIDWDTCKVKGAWRCFHVPDCHISNNAKITFLKHIQEEHRGQFIPECSRSSAEYLLGLWPIANFLPGKAPVQDVSWKTPCGRVKYDESDYWVRFIPVPSSMLLRHSNNKASGM